jgi:hypothetical protein
MGEQSSSPILFSGYNYFMKILTGNNVVSVASAAVIKMYLVRAI